MPKHYFPIKDKQSDIIILSDIYKESRLDDTEPEVWKHRVGEVMIYASTGNDEYGNSKNAYARIYLNADDVINLAKAIELLRNRSASKEAIQDFNDRDDLPF